MIEEDSKYFSLSGDIPVGGPSTWHITDWDQRRITSVTMDGEQDDESIAVEYFSRYSAELSPDIYRIYMSDTGEIVSTSSDPEDNKNGCVHYPVLQDAALPEGIQTISRNQLQEIDRLGPDVDLVTYPPSQKGNNHKVVFKYYFMWQYAHASWKEMNLWMRLPPHPNIVPFDRVVVDEHQGSRIVGFTNAYIPGGNLEENFYRVFKLDWLRQLIDVVDFLNLRCGISHQDIAPRNLTIEESADLIKLFDFNFAARINHPSEAGEFYSESRNDIKGVIFTVYEIITRDDTVRNVPHEDQALADIEGKWLKHPEVKLDHPVESYQAMLREWQEARGKDDPTGLPTKPPTIIGWPSRPEPPIDTILQTDPFGKQSYVKIDRMYERRKDVEARGEKVLHWQRPPQQALGKDNRLLSTGEVVSR